MKTIKFLLKSIMLMAVFTLGSACIIGSNSAEASARAQNGVSYTQAINYLQACSHHHTVNGIELIPGTDSYRADVDEDGVVTVNVVNGCITGHSDVLGAIIIMSNGN